MEEKYLKKKELELKARNLYIELKANEKEGLWSPSPVELKYMLIREALIFTPGMLSNFRVNFLIGGRHNFPDSPSGGGAEIRDVYFDWSENRSIDFFTRLKSWLFLIRMSFKLFRVNRCKLHELEDSMVCGSPGYPFPKSLYKTLYIIFFFILRKPIPKDCLVSISEVQIRNLYYRQEIESEFKEGEYKTVLETGGGYGALASDLLKRDKIDRYYFVELEDAIVLAFMYFNSLFSNKFKIQCLMSDDDVVDSEANIILLAPSRMHLISEEIDLYISTMTFQHQNFESIGFYLSQLDRLKAKNLFLVERDYKRDDTDIKISDYPIPKNYKNRLWKDFPFGGHIQAIFTRK